MIAFAYEVMYRNKRFKKNLVFSRGVQNTMFGGTLSGDENICILGGKVVVYEYRI